MLAFDSQPTKTKKQIKQQNQAFPSLNDALGQEEAKKPSVQPAEDLNSIFGNDSGPNANANQGGAKKGGKKRGKAQAQGASLKVGFF